MDGFLFFGPHKILTRGSEGLLIVPPLSSDLMLAGWEALRAAQALVGVAVVVLEEFRSPGVEAKPSWMREPWSKSQRLVPCK